MKKVKYKDLLGQKFGNLLVTERVANTRFGAARWKCKCDCGNTKDIDGIRLNHGVTKSCGCLNHGRIKRYCSVPDCGQEHCAKGYCTYHYDQLQEVKNSRAVAAAIRDKQPKRREQKRLNQMRYTVTPKAILALFHRWHRKKKNKVLVTDQEVLELRNKPCHKCGKPIEGAGIGFVLIKPRQSIELSNMLPSCGICKLIGPKESFKPIDFSKNILRRFWKKTPMAAIAKQRARKDRGRYQCAKCMQLYRITEVQIDHINPVVDTQSGYINLDTFVTRLFCDDSNLQILCKPCHYDKTAEENAIREKQRLKSNET